jgi:TRAP-type uncharacterized transport system fused permease subunit
VALAVFAAASLAKANMWSTGWAAMRAGAPAYIVPFMFIYEPALLTIGDWVTALHAAVSATVGVALLAAGLFGYLRRPLAMWQRALLIVAALLLIKPGPLTDLAGLALAAVVLGSQYARRQSAAARH